MYGAYERLSESEGWRARSSLPRVLEALARELMGLEALRAQVRKVRLAVGPSSQVSRDGQTLQLTTAVPVTTWLAKDDLLREIEKVL